VRCIFGFGLEGFGALRRGRCALLLAGIALAGALAVPVGASADTAPIPSSSDLPWSDPAHESPLELLAGRIASHIAGRPVTVRCEGDTDWATLVRQTGGEPSSESGYVGTTWNSVTGQLVSAASVAELAGGDLSAARPIRVRDDEADEMRGRPDAAGEHHRRTCSGSPAGRRRR
jgi:hypothetical protein